MRLPAISMLLLVRQLVDTRSVPGVVEVLRLRGRVHGAKFLGKRASPPRAGTTGNISHAQSIRRYLLPTWAVYYPFSSTARYQSYIFIVGVPHLSLASSLLSFLPAIVSHTSGSYVVVGLSRFLSASSHHLCGTDFVSSFRKAVLRKGPQNIEEHRALNILKSRHGIARPHSFASSSQGRSESLYSYKRHVYLFRNCSTKSS